MDEIRKMINDLLILTAELHARIVQLSEESSIPDSNPLTEEQSVEALIADAYENERLGAIMEDAFEKMYQMYKDLNHRSDY